MGYIRLPTQYISFSLYKKGVLSAITDNTPEQLNSIRLLFIDYRQERYFY